ncbi:RNA-binding protein Nova-1 [Eumeta japonica]|uniref:RNA-binding protein Nova-1 n=1 Tax=Eumeta variegata TaxID=151549 RepID=A0A4C1WH60_EUMVA|nr:RNA-binding protein Nova-1 [Eumeta japonica]
MGVRASYQRSKTQSTAAAQSSRRVAGFASRDHYDLGAAARRFEGRARAGGIALPPPKGCVKAEKRERPECQQNQFICVWCAGPGGRSLVEIQQMSGANIQISKKGTFAPGTRNRIVTISGTQTAIGNAQYLIEQKIQEEELKRTRHNAISGLMQ